MKDGCGFPGQQPSVTNPDSCTGELRHAVGIGTQVPELESPSDAVGGYSNSVKTKWVQRPS